MQNQIALKVKNDLSERGLLAGIVVAHDIKVEASDDALKHQLRELVKQRSGEDFPSPAVKNAVRDMLRGGGFKPAGRNKPASEYLAQAAREDRFPFINNLVDINNYVSLSSGLPISLLDLNEFGGRLLLRYGREGERFVFNSGGQDIDLAGLICACAESTDLPLGNAIKDSMQGKIKDTTTSVVGVIYSPSGAGFSESLKVHLDTFADLLKRFGGASSTDIVME